MLAPRIAFIGILVLLLPTAAWAQNIVLVIVDDMGVEALAAYAEQPKVALTPHIDALADEAVLFRNAWATPVCSPFRASVLTGLQPWQHGVGFALDKIDEWAFVLDWQQPNLANLLAAAGYRTAAVGKWHMAVELGFTNSQYFDGVPSTTEAHPNLVGFGYYAGFLLGGTDYFNWPKVVNGEFAGFVTTYRTTDEANEALAQSGGSEPFFLWAAFNAPHTPLHEPPHTLLADPASYDFSDPRDRFHAMIEALDTELGRLLAALDLTDTTVILVADNGTYGGVIEPPLLSDHGKRTVYEGGLNVPLLVAGQAIAPAARGQESAALVQATDLFATILEIAGVAGPEREDAVSLMPYLTDAATPSLRETVYSEVFFPNGGPPDPARYDRAAREQRYKLVRNGGDPDELYDLDLDPYEQTPLDLGQLTPEQSAAYVQLRNAMVVQQPPIVPVVAPALRGLIAALLLAGGIAFARRVAG